MFQIAGHTMGTPEYTVLEAVALFHDIGLDGAEIVVQDDYRSGIPVDCPQGLLQEIKDTAEKLGVKIILSGQGGEALVHTIAGIE